jgi:hypothetical protein
MPSKIDKGSASIPAAGGRGEERVEEASVVEVHAPHTGSSNMSVSVAFVPSIPKVPASMQFDGVTIPLG